MTEGITQAEFARRQGWERSYVTKLKHENRLVFDDAGRVDEAASLARIQETTAVQSRASDPAVSPAGRSDRDRQAFYDAEKSRLDLEERVRRLRDAAEQDAALADAAVVFRTALETWPERLTPDLAAMGGDEARIQAFLADEVEAVLGELSRRFAAMAAEPT
jgi:transcriptional regulator with XRE-family HTH domain